MVVIMSMKEKESLIGFPVLKALQILTGVLIVLLTFVATQANQTLKDLSDKIQTMQITMASESSDKITLKRGLDDHEARLRLLERKK